MLSSNGSGHCTTSESTRNLDGFRTNANRIWIFETGDGDITAEESGNLYTKSDREGSRVIANDPSFPASLPQSNIRMKSALHLRPQEISMVRRFDAISHWFDQELCVGSPKSQYIFDGRYGKVATKVLANLNAKSESKEWRHQ